ncbi:MAG: hypothetical protein RL263_242 [Bacteroidota bacterium]
MIHIRIFHGSVTKPFSGDTYRELGGFLGGHVAVQVYNRVYGFYYADRNKIHIFPNNRSKSSIFQNQSLEEWEEIVALKKETVISIPATDVELQWLKTYYEQNVLNPECDYSFWGERCASNCHRLLSTLGKIKPGSRFLKAFYPGQLIVTLKREAKKQGYIVRTKPGDKRRIWA